MLLYNNDSRNFLLTQFVYRKNVVERYLAKIAEPKKNNVEVETDFFCMVVIQKRWCRFLPICFCHRDHRAHRER